MAMTSIGRKEYLKEVAKHYRSSSKKHRGELLDGAEAITRLHRKYLIMRLRHMGASKTSKRRLRGRKRKYDVLFHDALLTCWHATNDICAERLQPFLPELVGKLMACRELQVTDRTKQLLCSASRSTVARHLQREQRRSRVSLSTTKPGSLMKSQIAVRRGRWEETNPGWLESDTVAHCGESAYGQFIHSYNFVDVASGWSEQIATMGKGERATVHSLTAVRQRFPFPILGIDSDNGSEYINGHLRRYCEQEQLSFTRSRPYQKNDNAHVEEKNWTAIRKIVGYARMETGQQLTILNELYNGPLRLYLNYFQPTRKRKTKLVDMGTNKKKLYYFEAKTPYQRLQEHTTVSQVAKELLKSEYNKLNPVKVLAEIQGLVEQLERSVR